MYNNYITRDSSFPILFHFFIQCFIMCYFHYLILKLPEIWSNSLKLALLQCHFDDFSLFFEDFLTGLVLSLSFPSPGIGHFSRESWFLLVKNDIKKNRIHTIFRVVAASNHIGLSLTFPEHRALSCPRLWYMLFPLPGIHFLCLHTVNSSYSSLNLVLKDTLR